MARLAPLPVETLSPEHRELLDQLTALLGFECNDWLTLARLPGVMAAAMMLCNSTLEAAAEAGEELRWLVCYATSHGFGCDYCIAHTAFAAERFGIPEPKLSSLKDFESSQVYSDAERAALRVAIAMGRSPSAVSDADFGALQEHFNETQVVAIVSLAAMMGFFNRWNDTMATELERAPSAAAQRLLAGGGWTPGKHGGQA